MNRLRAIVVEIHRRSIWQVLAIYLVGSWIAYQVIHALTDGLGLPLWVPAFAVVLFIIGLPIVLATAFVQEGPPPARFAAPRDPTLLPDIERFGEPVIASDAADARGVTVGAPAPRPGRATRLLTWGRALGGGVAAFLLLGLGTGGYMGMRAAGIGPAATLLSRGDLTDEDRLVLADFGATGPDTLLAAAITDALRIDLEQSPAVSLASAPFLQGAQQRMGRPQGAGLPEPVALQLAQREGLKVVITGDIARLGEAFTVHARVLRASDGEPLVSERERARGEADLLDAVDRLSRKLRERIGESLRSVRASEPLAQVTTGSIEALQLYSQAARLHISGSSNDAERAAQLAEQAIAIDPEFAMAYRLLGIISGNAIFDFSHSTAMLTRAYELGERLTERERLATSAAYHRDVSGEMERAIAAYEQLLSRYPDDLSALNNVAIIYNEQGDRDRAVKLYARIVAEDTTRRISHTNLVSALAGSGRVDEAQAALDLTKRRFPDDPQNERFQAIVHVARGDLPAARRSAETFRAEVRAPLARVLGAGSLHVISVLSAQPARAAEHRREMLDLLQQANATAGALVVASIHAAVRIEEDEPADRVLGELEAYLAQHGFSGVPPAERSYPELAVVYAIAGRHGRARELRDEFQREVVAPTGLRADEIALQALDGRLLVHEGRAAEGARLLRAARERGGCVRCLVPEIAWAFDEAAMPDSAIAYYDMYLDTPLALGPVELRWRTRSLLRAAELHAAAGNNDRARLYYGRLLELWADPEPSMRPRVDAVRASLTRLMGAG